MTVSRYADLFATGSKSAGTLSGPGSVSGVCGRVIRGKRPEDFLTLTDDPHRKLVLLMGPDGLEKMLGKSGHDMLVEIGYEASYIVRKVRDEGCQFKLIVFPEGGPAKLATWENVIDVVAGVYPDATDALRRNLPLLRSTTFVAIESTAGFDFSEVDTTGEADPHYMTYERFKASKGSLVDTRAFLYFTVHLREQYSGDGYTYTDDGRRGLMEFIVPNLPVASLGDHRLIDITVNLPGTPANGSAAQGAARKGAAIMTTKELPLPDFYVPGNSRKASYRADINGLMPLAERWRKQHHLKPVGSDSEKVHLLVIDAQVDFSFPPPDGALYVAGRSGTGAMDANRNTAEFIYRNLHLLSLITNTLDSHLPYQVFYSSAHLKADGTHPAAHTIIGADEYRSGLYRSNPAMAVQLGLDPVWLDKQWLHYCEQLEATGKYKLYLWPFHCMIGSDGHRLAGVIEEARLFHSWARGAANLPEIKGGNPLTECYSVFSPEVTTTWDGRAIPGAEKNTRLMDKLLTGTRVYLAGLASSHCVKESIADFLKYILSVDPELAKKLYILEDCIAPVVIPNGPDFTDDATKALDEFRAAGMHVVQSTDQIDL